MSHQGYCLNHFSISALENTNMELLSGRIYKTGKSQNLNLRKGCAVLAEIFYKQLILGKTNGRL